MSNQPKEDPIEKVHAFTHSLNSVLADLMNEPIRRAKAVPTIRLIRFKFLGATTYRCARVRLTDPWFETTRIIDCDEESAKLSAIVWLQSSGWDVTGAMTDNTDARAGEGMILIGEFDSKQQLR